MNPYRSGKLVLFQVTYDRDWHFFEIMFFVVLGIFGVGPPRNLSGTAAKMKTFLGSVRCSGCEIQFASSGLPTEAPQQLPGLGSRDPGNYHCHGRVLQSFHPDRHDGEHVYSLPRVPRNGRRLRWHLPVSGVQLL